MKFRCIFILIFSVLISRAEEQPIGLEEKLGAKLPEDIYVTGEDSVRVQLNKLISKPTLLTFVYYRCDVLCPKTLAGIAELVKYTEAVPGTDYNIIAISINHKETPAEAEIAKREYLNLISKPVSGDFWRFFVTDSITIRRLTAATGWEFRNEGVFFAHTTSSMLITPESRISQYFYGTYFNYMHFALSVEKASQEEVVPTRLKTLKYCYNYKPEKNRTVFLVTTISGVTMLLAVLIFFLVLLYNKVKPDEVS